MGAFGLTTGLLGSVGSLDRLASVPMRCGTDALRYSMTHAPWQPNNRRFEQARPLIASLNPTDATMRIGRLSDPSERTCYDPAVLSHREDCAWTMKR